LKAHDIPTDALEEGKMRILIIDSDWQNSDNLASALETKTNYQAQTAQNSFDAGLLAQKIIPHVIIVNLMAKDIDATSVCKYVRSNKDLAGTKIIASAGNLGENEANALLKKGFDAVLSNPSDFEQVFETIQQVTAIIY